MKHMLRSSIGLTAALAVVVIAGSASVAGQKQEEFRFRSGVDLVNVTATVVDRNGRFIPGLRQSDFIVYEEKELQEVTHFSNERVPVSLGLVLDTSGSMVGEKLTNALMAVDRFLTKLLSPEDEIFLYKFSNFPELVQDWTTNRQTLSRAIRRISANGGTAMYDAIAESVPLAQTGQHRKRAVVLISDGNDTDSQVSLNEVKQLIRESEVMVYAIGIDGQAEDAFGFPPTTRAPIPQPPIPSPFPGGRRPRGPGGVRLPQTASVPVAVSATSGTQDRAHGATTASTCTHCARLPTTAAAARKSCARAAISSRPRRTSPTSSASSTISATRRRRRKTDAGTPFAWKHATSPFASARGAAISRRLS